MHSTTSAAICKQLKVWFQDFGWPTAIRSDGGPQFRNNFSHFCSSNNIEHQKSSAYNPWSNGLAEAGVKAIKHMLIKTKATAADAPRYISMLRNMPKADRFSSAQLFLGRKMKQDLPMLPEELVPSGKNFTEGRKAREHMKAVKQKQFDEHAKTLQKLEDDTIVFVQHPKSGKWDTVA